MKFCVVTAVVHVGTELCCDSCAARRDGIETLPPSCLRLLPNLDNWHVRRPQNFCWVNGGGFMQIGWVASHTYFGALVNLYPLPHIYCPISVKFGMSGQHIMLLSVCELHEGRLCSSCGLCSVYRVYCVWQFESKTHLSAVWVPRHEVSVPVFSPLDSCNQKSTVIPRLTKIILSGITFVSRNLR